MPHTISYNIYIYEPLRKVDTINKTLINCVKTCFLNYLKTFCGTIFFLASELQSNSS